MPKTRINAKVMMFDERERCVHKNFKNLLHRHRREWDSSMEAGTIAKWDVSVLTKKNIKTLSITSPQSCAKQ